MQRDAQPLKPTSEEIARLAYLIWDKEGRPQGRDSKHWFEAESLLLAAKRQELKSLHTAMVREHLQDYRINHRESNRRAHRAAAKSAA